jgi:hypothetical protein
MNKKIIVVLLLSVVGPAIWFAAIPGDISAKGRLP